MQTTALGGTGIKISRVGLGCGNFGGVGSAPERGVSTAGLALGWVLAQPHVTAALVGPRRPEHFTPVREALTLDLEPADWHTITRYFEGPLLDRTGS